MSGFQLKIVTPEGNRFDGTAEALRVRTTEGYVSIRAGHTDYLAVLDIGEVAVTAEGQVRAAACSGGFLSVEKGEVRLVATTFEYASDIDVERAKNAEERARVSLEAATDPETVALAKMKLACAQNRQKVAGQ